MPLVERSYLSLLLERDPNFYADSAPGNQIAYEFSNGRRFRAPDAGLTYDNFKPYTDNVVYGDQIVFYGDLHVVYLNDGPVVSVPPDPIGYNPVVYGGSPVAYLGQPVSY
jgi:hypothetical protein